MVEGDGILFVLYLLKYIEKLKFSLAACPLRLRKAECLWKYIKLFPQYHDLFRDLREIEQPPQLRSPLHTEKKNYLTVCNTYGNFKSSSS